MNSLILIALVAAPPEQQQTAPQPEPRWYGVSSLALDAAGVVFLSTGMAMEALEPPNASMTYRGLADNLEGAGMAVLGIAAPAMHLYNHHPGRAALSFFSRAATFSALVAVREFSKQAAPQAVLAALFLAVIAGDDVWLARDEVQPPPSGLAAALSTVSPWVDTAHKGGGVSVQLNF
jgi:hypothetical protein